MKNVYVFLANGFEEIEALVIVDILRRAGVKVTTVSLTMETKVTGAHGIPVEADAMFADCDYTIADMMVLPGGMPGAANLARHSGLCSLIQAQSLADRWLAAICAAPMVFGRLGLLDGKKATCYPGFEGELTGAEYTAAPVEVEDLIITGKGPAAVFPFAYTLVEVLVGKDVADEVKKGMLYN